MQLSPNFTLAEMTRTDQPFANVPGEIAIGAMRFLCETVLQPIRNHFRQPAIVTSGYRSPRVNEAVGSKPGSQHVRGEASDIKIRGIPNPVLAAWIKDNLPFDQLILEAYRKGVPDSGWVHVSTFNPDVYRNRRLRREVLTMTMGSHGPVYSTGLNP